MSQTPHAEPTISLELTPFDEAIARLAETLLKQEPREMIFIDESTGEVIPLGTHLVQVSISSAEAFAREEQPYQDAYVRAVEETSQRFAPVFDAIAKAAYEQASEEPAK